MKSVLIFIVFLTVASLGQGEPIEEFFVPEGYVLQSLDLARGRIARPEGWFYTEGSGQAQVRWTISKEDASIGSYETGLSIQLFLHVQENTGKNPREFIDSQLEQISAVYEVISVCPETVVSGFNRRCIEVLQKASPEDGIKAYRMLYSFLWWDDGDIAIATVFGTPPELWDEMEEVRIVTSRFELLSQTEEGVSK